MAIYIGDTKVKTLSIYSNSGVAEEVTYTFNTVSDMKNSVLAFAANSTHQAETCMKLVDQMHFKSDEPSEAIKDDKNTKAFVFYLESLKHLMNIISKNEADLIIHNQEIINRRIKSNT